MRCSALLLLLASGLVPAVAQTSLVLQAEFDRDYYPAEAVHQVHVEFRIAPDAALLRAAPPVQKRNIALVIDRSASMAGERLQAVRTALAANAGWIGVDDFLSVVLFDSDVQVLREAAPAAAVNDLLRDLERVEPTGGSALYEALNQAAAQLRRHSGAAVPSQLILITDGPPTKGPRDTADFARLATALAEEGIALSAIGLGDEFSEDLLAVLARSGHGRFHFAPQAAALTQTLAAELTPPGQLVASNLTLSVEMLSDFRELQSYGSLPAAFKGSVVTYRIPYLFAGRPPSILFGAEMDPRRYTYRFARAKLTWTDPDDGTEQSVEKFLIAKLDPDPGTVARAANPATVDAIMGAILSEGLQHAIEDLDKGDPKRALRTLRRARADAAERNENDREAGSDALLKQFDAYLNELQQRGIGPVDRKLLRSGFNNALALPGPEQKVRR